MSPDHAVDQFPDVGQFSAHDRLASVGLGQQQQVLGEHGQPGDLGSGVVDRVDEICAYSVRAHRCLEFGLKYRERVRSSWPAMSAV
jgi:hypothetical protein